MTRNESGNEFDTFFHGEEGITLSYQEFINILKSNVSLMIYNLIEFTVANLMDCIYDRIKKNKLSYTEINDCLKKLWTSTILKVSMDPNASYNTIVKKSDYIIERIIQRSIIELKSKETLPGGNLDGVSITDVMGKHGISINRHSVFYRPDILENIKDKRNDLAHGSVSFVEALRDSSIDNIEENYNLVSQFLDELVEIVSEYLNLEKYKCS